GDQPRIVVRPLEGQRAEIHFSARGRSDPQDRAPDGEGGRPRDHYTYPGHFVALAVLATIHAGGKTHATLAAAAHALGIPLESEPPQSGPSDAARVAVLLDELDLLASLYLR